MCKKNMYYINYFVIVIQKSSLFKRLLFFFTVVEVRSALRWVTVWLYLGLSNHNLRVLIPYCNVAADIVK